MKLLDYYGSNFIEVSAEVLINCILMTIDQQFKHSHSFHATET